MILEFNVHNYVYEQQYKDVEPPEYYNYNFCF